ncbi:DUF2795 domain-containing protein [Arthrobacter sp. NyZ413]|uniref:DUF2795 domain-containing protein n=1 Tax=Arthrobacter sp. NyZ413 TaxID=3144669 RepID=UPI002C8A91A2|nr:DUF2795 domain-containing protein [Arthrobacter sp.]
MDVLIPTFERNEELAVTLAGLAAQSSPDFRVVISDQSSVTAAWTSPAVAAMVRVLRAQGRVVELLKHVPRKGMAEHRQFMLDQAKAENVLFLDDDVWLEPDSLKRLDAALEELGCGFVGMAPQGLSYIADKRPEQASNFSPWNGPIEPERIRPDTDAFQRWPLHSAANLVHLSADLGIRAGQWLAYRIAWLGGCVMYRTSALKEAGGFRFWTDIPQTHAGEDVLAQWRVMEMYGGAGILPSGAVHLEAPTTIPDRNVQAYDEYTERKETSVMNEAPNPIQIQKFLGGIDYPTNRETLIARAKASGADENAIAALQNLPDKEYGGPTDVSEAISGT